MKNRGWDPNSRSNSARCSESSAQPASRLVSHLLSVSLKRAPRDAEATFPFSVRAIRTLPPLDLSGQVTFFVGENGSGKSTLLEGIAAAAGLPTVGGSEVGRDGTLAAQRLLGRALRLVWAKRTHRGFFLRAEDFFG